MATTKLEYLDDHGVGTLIKLIKKGVLNVYRVKGTAIYADAAFLALTPAEKEAIATGASSIVAAGIYQQTAGVWTAIDTSAFTIENVGDVYDILNGFTTDATFREGADHEIAPGMNIVLVNIGTEASPAFVWDLLPGLLDLDLYQTKKLVNADGIKVFENQTPTVYTASTSLPASEPTASATITEGMVAVLGTGNEKDDVWRAHIDSETTPGTNEITWVKLGNQTTVEGMLEFLGHTCPNTPMTDEEIEDLWNRL